MLTWLNRLPYILIIILVLIILMYDCGGGRKSDPEVVTKYKIDTVFIHIHDTVKQTKIVYLKSKPDTIWVKSPENKPDTTYKGLLTQYKNLGNNYFATNIISTKYDIKPFGSFTVVDTVKENRLKGSKLITDLTIPVEKITKKEEEGKRQLYLGSGVVGDVQIPIHGLKGGFIYKNKQDRLYGGSVGWNGQIFYEASTYWKIKIRR